MIERASRLLAAVQEQDLQPLGTWVRGAAGKGRRVLKENLAFVYDYVTREDESRDFFET